MSRPEEGIGSTSGEVLAVGVGDPLRDQRYYCYVAAVSLRTAVSSGIRAQMHATSRGCGAIKNDLI